MGLVIRGKVVEVAGLTVKSWLDDPALRLRIGVGHPDGYHCGERTVRGVCHHTTKGIPGGTDKRPQIVKPGPGPGGKVLDVARFWSTSDTAAGAQLVNDRDGIHVGCLADLVYEIAYHCGSPNNEYSVGIEHYQDQDAGIWGATITSGVTLACALSDVLDIPRQVHWPYLGHSVPRLDKYGGSDYRGHYGHRDASNHRGAGDPGDFLIQALIIAGFDAFNVDKGEDLAVWRNRQAQLNAAGADPQLTVDGVPGKMTYYAMRQTGLLFGGCKA
jgi:hypothetical protein